ncbi:MAG TPA: RNA polymerase sigma-70 factor [Anaerovoracaceae bacterium]|nr:RNA polymerase sigma-70 factor [Anaerovoracaceae bacterium]
MTEKERMDGFLFEELKNGNSRAFDKIFNDHYQNLCRFAYSFVHDEDNAHSLVQHVFIKLWENRASLYNIDHFASYLAIMVRNHCLNYSKREKRNTKLEDIPAGAQVENSTENQVELHDFEEHLIVALTSLPERCKMAFEYSRFENFTNKEIAQKMEISTKGVEALIGRAIKSLRISLVDYLPSSMKSKFSNPILLAIFRMSINHGAK